MKEYSIIKRFSHLCSVFLPVRDMATILVTLCLLALAHFVSSETGCPDPEEIRPCVCTTRSANTYLECKGVNDAEVLRTAFHNSARYQYTEVYVEYCSLQFLPREMFESVVIKSLYLNNVTLAQLFDASPTGLDDLQSLKLYNTVLLRGILWQLLEPLKGLRTLTVFNIEIKSLGSEFSQYAPKSLQTLMLYNKIGTKSLMSGVFSDFPVLGYIEVSDGKLTSLKRDIFRVPFNGRYLYFENNKISAIPNDLFTQMPNLKSVRLRNNQITTVPESAFDSNFGGLDDFLLEDNPLRCDCPLRWITVKKPKIIGGKCDSPNRMQGKELKDLSPRDFNC